MVRRMLRAQAPHEGLMLASICRIVDPPTSASTAILRFSAAQTAL